jgi:alpha-beta hydrolase superfamily lysophospholipase
MRKLLTISTGTIFVLVVIYLCLCTVLSVSQEKIIFHPSKLSQDHIFNFDEEFEEIFVKTLDGIHLHSLLFKANRSKGLVFYLHGNGGSVDSWGNVADVYTKLGYDVLLLDYRGYGKSEGSISSEKQFFDDIQCAYNKMKLRYSEEEIIVLGYSIGTCAAAWIAAKNQPKLLILQAPYFSLTDLMTHLFPAVPSVVLEYKFETYKYLQKVNAPVVMFHGYADDVIYYESSIKLKTFFKNNDQLILLDSQGHNGMSRNPVYLRELGKLLPY